MFKNMTQMQSDMLRNMSQMNHSSLQNSYQQPGYPPSQQGYPPSQQGYPPSKLSISFLRIAPKPLMAFTITLSMLTMV